MEEKKTDRRTLKTRKAICDALMGFLTEKELNKVTVQEISDKADINRATFYKHYPEDFFKKLVDYVDKNRLMFKMVFSEKAPGELRVKFEKILEGLLQKIESEKIGTTIKDIKLSYQTSYRAQGCIAVLSRWIFEGNDQTKEFIIKVLSELDANTEKIMKH